jgi:hypothetical protein
MLKSQNPKDLIFIPDQHAEKGKPHHNPKAFLTRKKLSKSKPQIHLTSQQSVHRKPPESQKVCPKNSPEN